MSFEKAKKGLECCMGPHLKCLCCPYALEAEEIEECRKLCMEDALKLVLHLEEKLKTTKEEAYQEIVYLLKQIPRSVIFKNEIDNVLKEKLGGNDV